MKNLKGTAINTLLTISLLSAIYACNEPMGVTGRPNAQDATSGTLGSARSTNQLPPSDTPRSVLDTTNPKKN